LRCIEKSHRKIALDRPIFIPARLSTRQQRKKMTFGRDFTGFATTSPC